MPWGGRVEGLLLPHDPAEILIGQVEQALQLCNPLFADLAGRTCGDGLVQEALRLFLVCTRYIKCVFQCCVMRSVALEGRVVFHENSVVPFPG